jgi:hypothetical protein
VSDVEIVVLIGQVPIHAFACDEVGIHEYTILLVACHKAAPYVLLIVFNKTVNLVLFFICLDGGNRTLRRHVVVLYLLLCFFFVFLEFIRKVKLTKKSNMLDIEVSFGFSNST